ncbi:sensor histidine kinase [Actinophytocola sp. KF-1]
MRALDIALGAATAAAVVVGTALAGEPVTYGGTVPLAVALGGALLFRRRWPVHVLVASVVVLCGFGGSDLGAPGFVWPVTVAYAGAVLAGEPRWAIGVGVANLGVLAAFAASPAQLGGEALWLVAVLAAAQAYVGTRRTAALAERGRAAEERLVVARELHDIVAHTLAVVGIHLNVVADTLDDDPAEAREALRLAQSVRGQAMADLRSLIDVLRTGPHVPDLRELVERTGLPVRLDGDLSGLPAPVAMTVFRVVQEGLTNVLKHARASSAVVTVTRDDDAVTVSVVEDGRGGTPGEGGGHGLAGMRERVAAHGGTLTAGPVEGGFALSARLPLP